MKEIKIYKPILFGLLIGTVMCFFWGFYLGIDRSIMGRLEKELMIAVAVFSYGALYAQSKLSTKYKYPVWGVACAASILMALYTFCVFYQVVFHFPRR